MNRKRLELRMALVAAMFLLSCLPASACQSNQAEPHEGVDWDAFIPVGPSDEQALTTDQLRKQTGFPFVLPSYLPETTTNAYIASVEEHNTGNEQAVRASIRLFPGPQGAGAPAIEITEWRREPDEPRLDKEELDPGEELTTIEQNDVACRLDPHYFLETPPPPLPTVINSLVPGEERYLTCRWDTEQLHLSVLFSWTVTEEVPGLITQEMRDEAMKVVTSMIEDPYIP